MSFNDLITKNDINSITITKEGTFSSTFMSLFQTELFYVSFLHLLKVEIYSSFLDLTAAAATSAIISSF